MKQNRRELTHPPFDRDLASIENQQRAIPVNIKPLRQFIVNMNSTLGLASGALAVRLITNREMTRLNHAYRRKNKPTDVLSFPVNTRTKPRRLRAQPKSPITEYLGDIAISPVVAHRNAKRLRRTLDAELQILILHGALHLLGYDHEMDNGEMERAEMKLRLRLGIA
jgi:probable rRNA maturation factor